MANNSYTYTNMKVQSRSALTNSAYGDIYKDRGNDLWLYYMPNMERWVISEQLYYDFYLDGVKNTSVSLKKIPANRQAWPMPSFPYGLYTLKIWADEINSRMVISDTLFAGLQSNRSYWTYNSLSSIEGTYSPGGNATSSVEVTSQFNGWQKTETGIYTSSPAGEYEGVGDKVEELNKYVGSRVLNDSISDIDFIEEIYTHNSRPVYKSRDDSGRFLYYFKQRDGVTPEYQPAVTYGYGATIDELESEGFESWFNGALEGVYDYLIGGVESFEKPNLNLSKDGYQINPTRQTEEIYIGQARIFR